MFLIFFQILGYKPEERRFVFPTTKRAICAWILHVQEMTDTYSRIVQPDPKMKDLAMKSLFSLYSLFRDEVYKENQRHPKASPVHNCLLHLKEIHSKKEFEFLYETSK